MARTSYSQIYEHVIDTVKGPAMEDCIDVVLENAADTQYYKGAVGYIDADGKFALGASSGLSGNNLNSPVHVIAYYDKDDFGVDSMNGSIGLGRNLSGGTNRFLSFANAVIFRSSEFVSTNMSAARVGDAVSADAAGDIKLAEEGEPVIGILAKAGVQSHDFGIEVIEFIPLVNAQASAAPAENSSSSSSESSSS